MCADCFVFLWVCGHAKCSLISKALRVQNHMFKSYVSYCGSDIYLVHIIHAREYSSVSLYAPSEKDCLPLSNIFGLKLSSLIVMLCILLLSLFVRSDGFFPPNLCTNKSNRPHAKFTRILVIEQCSLMRNVICLFFPVFVCIEFYWYIIAMATKAGFRLEIIRTKLFLSEFWPVNGIASNHRMFVWA